MAKPFNPKDKYFHKAKEEGYKARSAFKLQEIQERFQILRRNDLVLDLGAAPGSFLQYTSQIIGPNGVTLGLDLQEIELNTLPNVYTEVCDMFDEETIEQTINRFLEQINSTRKDSQIKTKFDTIVADLAPKTSGVKDVDQWRSVELNQQVLEVAHRYLKKKGNCLMKVFQGADFDDFLKEVKRHFKKVKVNKPKAVRASSFEVYIVCQGKL